MSLITSFLKEDPVVPESKKRLKKVLQSTLLLAQVSDLEPAAKDPQLHLNAVLKIKGNDIFNVRSSFKIFGHQVSYNSSYVQSVKSLHQYFT